MMTKKVALVVLPLVVAFVGVLVWAILTRIQLSETQDTLSSTRAQLAMTTAELEETKGRLANITNELISTNNELASANNELASTKNQLNSTQQALSSTQQQLAVAQETLRGLGITLSASKECYDVNLVDNPSATNPTWGQLMTFLSQDQTETHAYIKDVYDCSQFSRDVHNNAEVAGIRAGEVQVKSMYENEGHSLNAFLTTDYGLVYVDCTGVPDKIARVEASKKYRAVELYRIIRANIRNDYWWDTLSSYYYLPSSTGAEVVTLSIRIYW